MSYTIDKPEQLWKRRKEWEKGGKVKLAAIREDGTVVTVVRWPTGNVRVYRYFQLGRKWGVSCDSDTVGIPKSLRELARALNARLLED